MKTIYTFLGHNCASKRSVVLRVPKSLSLQGHNCACEGGVMRPNASPLQNLALWDTWTFIIICSSKHSFKEFGFSELYYKLDLIEDDPYLCQTWSL